MSVFLSLRIIKAKNIFLDTKFLYPVIYEEKETFEILLTSNFYNTFSIVTLYKIILVNKRLSFELQVLKEF